MSIAIQVTTHAPAADVEKLEREILALVKKLDAGKPDDRPESTARIFGTDYSDPAKPISVEQKLGK